MHPAMRSLVLALIVAAGCATAHPDAVGVSVEPTTVMLAAGEQATLTAMGDDLVGLTWTSDADAIVTVVGADGGTATLTAVKPGHATVSVLAGAMAASVDVTVTAATLASLEVTAAPALLPLGGTTQLHALAHFTDRTTMDVTDTVAWSLLNPTLGSIDVHGVLMSRKVGTTDAIATQGTITGKVSVMVSAAMLVSVAIMDPSSGSLPKGKDRQLTATGTFTDGTTSDVTTVVAWTSSDDAIATVAAGLVHAVAIGASTITATQGPATATRPVAVGAAVIDSLALDHADSALALGRDLAVKATATYSDGTTADVTSLATWTATGTAATVTSGAVHAAAMGTSTVTAAIDSASKAIAVTVGPAVVDHLQLSTGDVSLAQHQRAHLRAALVYSDASVVDVTGTATWSSSTAAATVAAGVVDAGAAAGSATIKAVAAGFTATITATVGATACHVVINEVQAGGNSSSDEWAEIYNPCTTTVDVTGWTLNYRAATNAGTTDSNLLVTLSGMLLPGDFRLYAGTGLTGATADASWGGGSSGLLQGTSGGLGLRAGPKDTGTLIDAVAYGTVNTGFPFAEGGTSAPALAIGKSVVRSFDGNDTNDNESDFVLSAAPTPRAAN